ncbi:hypothetical protein ALI22I_35870 [Saccharothrix sp. ALI-22-I]|uniref:hypothetical protein n=1 Tax=Saccharothrix sp. ALI-22-I TaxID=1933778 RepID=UPI00097C094A|nr:hypothetical protein [Saccharothrix sp. ALI-22-I]ONI83822.1 hypothetical protein ALI22I_35870 [Saccharothrix sp. ALI-22-I]
MTAPDTPISSPPGMEITEKNKFKGSMFISAWDEMITTIGKDAETETEKALDITFAAIGTASSMAMLAVDPFGTILGAGIGWLIEHVSFLKEPLDQLMGDPDEIEANVEATKAQAAELRVLAEDHRRGLVTFDGWSGASSEAFKVNMDSLGQELDSLANAVEQKAKIVAICGVLVSVLRDIVRDLIAQLLGSLLAGALIAAASAFITFGASVVAYIGFATGKAVALGVNISSRIARLTAALARQMGRIKNLDEITEKVGKGWNRFENVADVAEVGYESWKAQKGVDRKIDEALATDAQNDKVTDANSKAKEANEKYTQAKEAETKASEEAAKANEGLNAASQKASDANDRASAFAKEAEAAAARGDQAGFDAANAKFEAAKVDADAARAEAARAAEKVADESRDVADAAKSSNDALNATKPSDEASKAAYDEYKRNNPGTDDPARTSAENDMSSKNDAAKQANAQYEQANVDFTAANAAAAEANAKAFASGSDADIKAAEEASRKAEQAGSTVEKAADDAKSAGEAAKSSYDSFQSQYSKESSSNTQSGSSNSSVQV